METSFNSSDSLARESPLCLKQAKKTSENSCLIFYNLKKERYKKCCKCVMIFHKEQKEKGC